MVAVLDASEKIKAVCRKAAEDGHAKVRSATSLYMFAESDFGLTVKPASIRSSLNRHEGIPQQLLNAMAHLVGLKPDDMVLLNGTAGEFTKHIGLHSDRLVMVRERPENSHDQLASVEIKIAQGREEEIEAGDDVQIFATIRLNCDWETLETGCELALGRFQFRLAPTCAEITERLKTLNADTATLDKNVKISLGGAEEAYWRFVAPKGTILEGEIEAIFCRLSGIFRDETVTATISTVIKDIEQSAQPPNDGLRSEDGAPLDNLARAQVLKRLREKALPISDSGMVDLGRHKLHFRTRNSATGE